jgi:arabinose-5-phosphate isomerase
MQYKNIILKFGNFPTLNEKAVLKDAIDIMNNFKLGSICVVKNNKKLVGIITDGDIRRKLVNFQKPFPEFMNSEVKSICSKKPITIKINFKLNKILKFMNKKKIWDLPVVSSNRELVGIIHLHDLLKFSFKKNK